MIETADTRHHDVIIMGGGLAGLTLSLQLKKRFGDLSILVVERRSHPVPLAAHKVGESSVEIGAHYFDTVLGLKEHLHTEQLKKFGFRFFFSDGRRDLDQVTELGGSRILPTTTYQIDRGIFENKLGELALDAGVQFVDNAVVRQFTLGTKDDSHRISYQSRQQTMNATSRWLVDASGRAGLIKRKLDLAQTNEHNAGAVWFRMGKRIDINDWSDDPAWLNACNPPNRWLSTNHLVGEGYWVWLIPLASGAHSVGIVVDARTHPVEDINTFDKAMAWLERHQPRLYDHLDAERDTLQDFAFFKRFSYGCKQVFSGENRWALTGEAGLFLDPFYSPGSDFIAIGNTYITELIAHDRNKAPVAMYADFYQQVYFSLYQTTLSVYVDQYALFGDPEVLPHKVSWDYAYYWGVMCPLFIQNRLVNVSAMARLHKPLVRVQKINVAMQDFFREWGKVSLKRNPSQLLDQTEIDWFAELNSGLKDQLDDAAFAQRMADNFLLLQQLAEALIARACGEHPDLLASPAGAALKQVLDDKVETLYAGNAPMLFSNAAY